MDVSAIKATEICDSDGGSTDLLKGFGFGERPQVLNGDAPAIRMLDRIYRPTAAHVADQLWGGVSRIERHIEPILAKERFVAKSLTCEPGTIAALKMRWDAYGTNQNCSTIEEVWYLRREDCPYDVKDPIEYRISIEGNPLGASFSFTVSATPGTAHNKHIGHLITSANMLQAIPRVCEAPPGLVFSELFSHAKSDLRDLHPASQFGIARPL